MSDRAHGKHRTNCACAKLRIDIVTTRAQIFILLLWCFLRHEFQKWKNRYGNETWMGNSLFLFIPDCLRLAIGGGAGGGGGAWGAVAPQTKIGAAGAEKHFYGCIWHFLWHRRPFFLAPATSYTPGRLQNTVDHNSAVESASAIHFQNHQRQKCRLYIYLLLLLFLIYFVR